MTVSADPRSVRLLAALVERIGGEAPDAVFVAFVAATHEAGFSLYTGAFHLTEMLSRNRERLSQWLQPLVSDTAHRLVAEGEEQGDILIYLRLALEAERATTAR